MCGKVQLLYDTVSEATTKEAVELAEMIQQKIQEFLEDANSSPACGGVKRLVESLAEMPSKDNPEQFSFWVASKLQLSVANGLQLLKCTSTPERLKTELDLINQRDSRSANCTVQ